MITALQLRSLGFRPVDKEFTQWGKVGHFLNTTPFTDSPVRDLEKEFWRVFVRSEPTSNNNKWITCYIYDELVDALKELTYYDDYKAVQAATKDPELDVS